MLESSPGDLPFLSHSCDMPGLYNPLLPHTDILAWIQNMRDVTLGRTLVERQNYAVSQITMQNGIRTQIEEALKDARGEALSISWNCFLTSMIALDRKWLSIALTNHLTRILQATSRRVSASFPSLLVLPL